MKTVTSSTRSPADLDFARYRVSRNPFAARVAREGVQLVHDAPSTISLRAIPEVDLTRARRNPYARRP